MRPDPNEEWIFGTRHIGRRVLVFGEIESSNSIALTLAGSIADSFAVIALDQSAGRGRFGRSWRSRPGSSLLLSVVLRTPPELHRPSILTAWAAVAVSEAVEQLAGVESRIKWPNDLLVDGRKVCGILIEQGAATVVGIGLNLNQTDEEFASAGLPLAASIGSICGATFDPKTAAETVLLRLDSHYERLLSGHALLEREWARRTGLPGRQVEVERSDGSRMAGRVRTMAFSGLELELPGGECLTLVPEVIEHIRPQE